MMHMYVMSITNLFKEKGVPHYDQECTSPANGNIEPFGVAKETKMVFIIIFHQIC